MRPLSCSHLRSVADVSLMALVPMRRVFEMGRRPLNDADMPGLRRDMRLCGATGLLLRGGHEIAMTILNKHRLRRDCDVHRFGGLSLLPSHANAPFLLIAGHLYRAPSS